MFYLDIFKALNDNKIRYLVVGGIAVNLHGMQRSTADLDLIVALDSANALKFAETMKTLGYRPKVPVDALEFADPAKRNEWINEKNMLVFSFYHPNDPMTLVDIFVKEPMPFAEMEKRKEEREAFGVKIPVASINDIIALKSGTGRKKDEFDIEGLKELLEYDGNNKDKRK